jgi:putative heme transporter
MTESPRRWSPPPILIAASEVATRSLLVAGGCVLAVLALARLRLVVIPLVVALIVASALTPVVDRMHARRVPRAVASLAIIVAGLLFLAGLVFAFVRGLADRTDELRASWTDGVASIEDWLATGPLGVDAGSLDTLRSQIGEWTSGEGGSLAGSALSGAIVAAEVVAGLLICIVLTFFFLKDGEHMWQQTKERLAGRLDRAVRTGERISRALRRFVVGTTANAVIEGVLVAVLFVVLGVPLAAPLALLTALGAYIPFLGALLAGAVATVVALATNGLTTALIVAGAYVVLQNVEGDLLQPLVLGKALRFHPVAILLAVSAGGVLGGIAGAALAVPVLVAAREVVASLASTDASATAMEDGAVRGSPSAEAGMAGDAHVGSA